MKFSRTFSSKKTFNSAIRTGTLRLILSSCLVIVLVSLGASQLLFVSAQNNSDTKEPSDVETLTAEPGDAEIKLTWRPATDDTAVTGYKIYMGDKAVKDDEDTYNLPTVNIEAVTEYVVKNLRNDQSYYFSITGIDAAGNESINYSPEASATPKAGLATLTAKQRTESGARPSSVEDNGAAPQVKSVVAENNVTVLVTFSEAVELPNEQPSSAFTIQTADTKERLDIQKAEVDDRDNTGATIILTTEPQTEEVEYIVTAGIELKDLFDNPVVSGTSDTGSFKGKKADVRVAEVGNSDTQSRDSSSVSDELTVISGTADFNDRMQIVFSEPIQLPNNPLTAVSIVQKGTGRKLNVLNVSLSTDGSTVYLITEKQDPVEYEVQFGDIRDEKGKSLPLDTKYIVTGKGAGVKDTVPPEDVLDFLARVKNIQKSIIELRWKPSPNTAGDLADYLVYQSEGKNTSQFGEASSLGSNTTSVEVQNLNPGKWYTFKMTAKDTSGNENKGVLSSVYLPETGPGMIAAALTGIGMAWYRRKKKM